MPGYQQLRFVPQATELYQNDTIYDHVQKKKRSKAKKQQLLHHEDLKVRNLQERKDYERMLMAREMSRGGDFNPYKFDSLKLIGSCNDVNYLDNFMSMPRQRSSQDSTPRNRTKAMSKSSTTVFGKGQKEHRNSIQSDSSMTAAILANLRSVASDGNIYESVEMIHYKKTLQNLHRIQKTRTLQKTGHSLFDSLREEQALKGPPARKISNVRREDLSYRSQEYSDGSSPIHSSSSSGDEYDIYPRMRQPKQMAKTQSGYLKKHEKQKSKRVELTGSESDEDWKIIPRPKFFGGRTQNRRAVEGPPSSTDESDSSLNSVILR